MAEENVTIPAHLVSYVALGLRVALSELRSRADLTRKEIEAAKAEGTHMPGAVRMSLEGSAKNADELRAVMVQAYRELPEAIRPRADLMTMPGEGEQ